MKKDKKNYLRCIHSFILPTVLSSISVQAFADRYATVIYGGAPLTISSNETALVTFAGGANMMTVNYQKAGTTNISFFLNASNGGGNADTSSVGVPSLSSPLPLVGPATISVTPVSGGGFAALGAKVVSTDTTSGSGGSGIPSTAVVIPQDATGPVQIILESSKDLITWTAANPGTYGSSATNRFFRVRAVGN